MTRRSELGAAHEPGRALPKDELANAGMVELARALVERLGMLGRAEVELAREEMAGDVHRGKLVGGFAGASGTFLIAAMCCGLVAAILALGTVLPVIWVALVGACIFALLGFLVGLTAWSEAKALKPERTLRQARATAELLRHPLGHPIGGDA